MDQPPVDNTTDFVVHPQLLVDKDGEKLVAIVKATFVRAADLTIEVAAKKGQRKIRFADVPWGKPEKSSILYPSDLCLLKPGTDVIVVAKAHAPGGKAVPSFDVAVRVGALQKLCRIYGLRVWQSGGNGLSAPRPIAELEMRYDHAWGGVDDSDPMGFLEEARNPVGVGIARDSASLTHQAAPGIEDIAQPIVTAKTRPPPAGIGAIGRHWEPRRKYAGTYDARWLEERLAAAAARSRPAIQPLRHTGARGHTAAPWRGRGGAAQPPAGGGATAFLLPRVGVEIEFRVPDRPPEVTRPHLDTVLIDLLHNPRKEERPLTIEYVWRASIKAPRRMKDARIIVREREVRDEDAGCLRRVRRPHPARRYARGDCVSPPHRDRRHRCFSARRRRGRAGDDVLRQSDRSLPGRGRARGGARGAGARRGPVAARGRGESPRCVCCSASTRRGAGGPRRAGGRCCRRAAPPRAGERASPGITLEVCARGSAGAAFALPKALEALAARQMDALVLGGVHTDYDPATIAAFAEQGRLHGPKNLDAVIPGEAAAFVILMRESTARRLHLEPAARISGIGSATTRALADNDESVMDAKGLTTAVRAAAAELVAEQLRAGWLLTDHTFESTRILEWQTMATRAHALFGSPYHLEAPAQRLGHLGAASLPLSIALAAEGGSAVMRPRPSPWPSPGARVASAGPSCSSATFRACRGRLAARDQVPPARSPLDRARTHHRGSAAARRARAAAAW